MASNANIEAAKASIGSDACWTIPGVVSWPQGDWAMRGAAPENTDKLMSDTTAEPEIEQPYAVTAETNATVTEITTRRRDIAPADLRHYGAMAVTPNIVTANAL